jgi:hypothetical protein
VAAGPVATGSAVGWRGGKGDASAVGGSWATSGDGGTVGPWDEDTRGRRSCGAVVCSPYRAIGRKMRIQFASNNIT